MSGEKSAGANSRGDSRPGARIPDRHDWVLDKAIIWDLLTGRGALCGNHPANPNQSKLKSNLRIAKRERKRKVKRRCKTMNRLKTWLRPRKILSLTIGGAPRHKPPTGVHQSPAIPPGTPFLQTSLARRIFISAVT